MSGTTITEHPARLPGVRNFEELRNALTLIRDTKWCEDGTPSGIEHDNTRRASFAADALLAYADRTFSGAVGEDFHTVIGDLLGDLMHLCDALVDANEDGRLDFDALVDRGRSHYTPELSGLF